MISKAGKAKVKGKSLERLTISNKMSPAAKASPSASFQPAIPPSVMVGDMAGILNDEDANRTTVGFMEGKR